MKYSIVIVNYKTYQLTSICLKLLRGIRNDLDVEIWVVDNDSNDESVEYLRTLDWINLIERNVTPNEQGFMAHGRALDEVLPKVTTDYLFVLHTDTFIHNSEILNLMLERCEKEADIAAVGCVDQIYRGQIRIVWRFVNRLLSHYSRRLKLMIGLPSKQPKSFYEVYVKSFCALWNVRLMKEHGLTFNLNGRTPGYEAQDKLLEKGYKISLFSARKMFRYLDHVESGTVSAQGLYGKNHRRTKKYHAFLERMSKI